MKKSLYLIFLLFLIIPLSACADNSTDIPDVVNFYYTAKEIDYHSENGFISSEKRNVKNEVNDLTSLINLYLLGAEDLNLKSPFPENVSVKNIIRKNSIFTITLSKEFAQLTGFDLSVACACLTLTIQEFVDSNLVQISAEDSLLDGNTYISMNADSLVTYDNVIIMD